MLLGVVMGSAGCGSSPPPVAKPHLALRLGKFCLVQFRRGDGLGTMRDLPVGPEITGINDSMTSMKGTLQEVSEEWITLVNERGTFCIPCASILLVRFESAEPSPDRPALPDALPSP